MAVMDGSNGSVSEYPEYYGNSGPVPEAPPIDMDGYISEEMGGIPEMPPITLEETNIKEYILGKPSKAKEKYIKIKDITANDGRVTLEGRKVTCEVKETKSGKGMIIFDLYDGTGTITCKSFAKDYTEGKEITEKIENAKAIKVIRKSRTRCICRRYYSNCKYNNRNRYRCSRITNRRRTRRYTFNTAEHHKI